MKKTRMLARVRPRAAHVRPTVAALLETVIDEEFGGGPLFDRAVLDHTVEVMLERVDLMPGYLSLGMVMLTATFERAGGRAFHKLPLDQRRAALARWKAAPVGLIRNFTDFYTKMGIFAYCARLEEVSGDTYLKPRGRVRGVA